MKIFQILATSALSLVMLNANAQNDAPKGFVKGSITLADNTTLNGYIKDKISKEASVVYLSNGKETIYTGAQLNGAETTSGNFICIHGDFFKVISNGSLNFLQKSSDASSQPSYNGLEVVFNNGTEGNPGDYFVYNGKSKELKLVSKKTLSQVVASTFEGYAPAVEKAKAAESNLVAFKDAVDAYNSK
jgi:hypothetical protein